MNLSVKSSSAKRMKHVIARAIACSMLLVLPSCGIPPLRHAEPGPGLPADNGPPNSENSAQLGIEEFYNDPKLTCLIQQALVGNRELKVLNEDVQIAGNEVLARSGAYLPFVSVAAGAGLNRYSAFTLEGAGLKDDPFRPGKFFPNPMGNFLGGVNLVWQLDIYRQLRNARDAAAQRYIVASERRNFFVTRLVAEIAENYYRLMAFDQRIVNLNQIIELSLRNLDIAKARMFFARGTELGCKVSCWFQAEVQVEPERKLLIVNQDIVVAENRTSTSSSIAMSPGRPVERRCRLRGFFDLTIHPLYVGVPSQLLQNRPDIREAERELAAAGLDVQVARVNFFPQLVINAGVGLQAFSLRYMFEPQAVIGDIAGGLVGPLVNKRAIRAAYLAANARQLQTIYNYQRVILNAFTEVINRVSMVEKYSQSIEIKKQQLTALEESVKVAGNLFQNARTEYLDVLLALQALFEARVVLIQTKVEQLSAIVNTYQALGGGVFSISTPADFHGQFPYTHTVRSGENFWTISLLYYRSGRYGKALWAANKNVVPAFDGLAVGDKIIIPRPDRLDPALIEEVSAPAPPIPQMAPGDKPAIVPPLPPPPPPPPTSMPGPFGQDGTKDPAVKTSGGTAPPAASPKPATTGK